jgi:hypothetical protein
LTTISLLPDVGTELREGYAAIRDTNLHCVEAGDAGCTKTTLNASTNCSSSQASALHDGGGEAITRLDGLHPHAVTKLVEAAAGATA